MSNSKILYCALAGLICACHSSQNAPVTLNGTVPIDAGVRQVDIAPLILHAQMASHRFFVAEHMRASIEMQLSGEPFAQSLGYDLTGFDRTLSLTDQYLDPVTKTAHTDPLGYAFAVESYEYSKQPMNNLSFESGAGLSLMFGPVLNPAQVTQAPAFQRLSQRFQTLAIEANAAGSAGDNLIVAPVPEDNPLNRYGWPGLWPVFAEFSDFDPRIKPDPGAVNSCTAFGSMSILYTGGVPEGMIFPNYECDYNSLNLPDREAQVRKVLQPKALGYAAWKQGLWIINYWSSLHDSAALNIIQVNPQDQAQVGQPDNQIIGMYVDPGDPSGQRLLPGQPGVYLGDTPMEGWQGLLMLEELDNKAALLLKNLVSGDGQALRGAPSLSAAVNYSYDAELLYFPTEIAVAETPTAQNPNQTTQFFPQPTQFTIIDNHSHLSDLSGLLGGFSEAFAMTDGNNASVGGSLPFRVTFDGDPFPQDDGLANGEATFHDRTLGILKIALIDLDRLHFDHTARVLTDTASLAQGAWTRGARVSTVELSSLIVALRNTSRALNGTLQLYSNDTPDTNGVLGALDGTRLTGAPYSGSLQAHLTELIRSEADFMATYLIDPSGAVSNSYDLHQGQADLGPTQLESEAAAMRGLLEAYLATSDQKYRQQAMLVYADLNRRFWSPDQRLYRTLASGPGPLEYTPTRYGFLSGALRQYYKLVASAPERKEESVELLARFLRTTKLVLNGWDDRNGDNQIQYPDECSGAGLQQGERALTGEFGRALDHGDRDRDCVPEISTVNLPAALGAQLDITH